MNELEVVLRTLKNSNDGVLEITSDLVVTNVWFSAQSALSEKFMSYEGKPFPLANGNHIDKEIFEQIAITAKTGARCYKEYYELANELKFGVNVVAAHPEQRSVFVLINQLSFVAEPTENKWKLAMDATGDGVWDMHIPTSKMFFSEKWYDIFGYEPGDLLTINDWTSKIFPEDLLVAEQKFNEHLSGQTANYSCELRYACKDGSYKWILSRGIILSKSVDGKPERFLGTHTDISDRKLMEDAGRANTSLLFRLINNLPSGILVTDESRKLVFVNKAFCELYGIEKHPRELAGMDAEESLKYDKLFYKDPDALVARIQSILAAKTIVLKDELEMLDGRIISRDYIPLALDDNHRGEIWKFTDITAQKNSDRRFQEQRAFYEHILNSLPTSVVALDPQMRILFANPQFIKNDQKRQELTGKTLQEFCMETQTPPDITAERMHYFNTAAIEKRKIEWDEKIVHHSGRVSYQLRCFLPIFKSTGELDIMIASGVDITDRKIAEEALKTTMDAFANSFSNSGISKALLSPDGKWLQVNDMLCELIGYSRAELLQMSHADITYHEDIDLDTTHIEQLMQRTIETYTIEKRYISKNRQIITASLTVLLLWNADNTPKYFICDIIDITAKKLLNDELYRQNAELEATKTTLINKISQLEELSYMIAHNLRGPAGNIKMFSERLIMDDNDPAAEDEVFTKDEAGEIIFESSIKLSNSLETLMELAQIKLNNNIAYHECNFENFINDIINQLQGVIYEKHAQVLLQLNVATLPYPKVYLESILYNLISNALKYSNPAVAPIINISTRSVEGKISLIVKDNGLGIDMDLHRDKVFKLNKVFHKGYDSKGVGLFLTKSQIESLGGSISLESKPMEGCEFTVVF